MAITDLLLAGKTTVTEPVLADGQVSELTLTADGRQRVSQRPSTYPLVTGNLVALNDQVATKVDDASNIIFHFKNTGTVTMVAGIFAFEASLDSTNGTDGTWFPVQAVRTNANTVETATPTPNVAAAAGAPNGWKISVVGYSWFRVRVTTAVTASSIGFASIQRAADATDPVPSTQTHAVTSSGTFTVTPATASAYALVTAATTNGASVKTTAAHLFEVSIFNVTAATIYVKLYNKASAPTVGTDVPILTIPVTSGAVFIADFGALGKRFATGLAIAVTAAAVATDATAVAAGAQIHASYI